MELHENRTELERLLADVWDYEDGGQRKTHLPKWLFAVTLAGAVLCTSSAPDVLAPVTTAFAPGATPIDRVSSQNLDEDLDYRIAGQTKSLVGWRTFLEAHPDGPHAQAAQAEIERLSPTPRRPIESAEQSPPSAPATQTPVETAQPLAPPATSLTAENEPAAAPQPDEAAEQSTPSPAATQTPVEAAQSPASVTPRITAENEPATSSVPSVAPDRIAASPPLPPLRPRGLAVAKLGEPTHHRHGRAEQRQSSQPNVLTILIAQLLHRQPAPGHRGE
jgi:hypothetical protein